MKAQKDFTPVYYQLAEDLKELIQSGELKPGDPVPSESRLGAEYGISRMTVRRGLALLSEAGIIETIRGKGNYVAKPRLNQVTLTFAENDCACASKLTYQLLEVKRVAADAWTAGRLSIAAGTKVFAITRIISGENGPAGLDLKYLPYIKGKPVLENELQYADFPEIVARHTDVTIYKIEMNISATALPPAEAELLKILPGYPGLCVTQVVYAKDGQPLGISKTTYRGGAFELKAVSYPYSGRV